ncbi:MAG TPA: hypothetical protein DCL35_02095 [Candidatus Omnitrophica bacterium]|nr:hypothetical protein [Candidatus Omnitrophota bacterium]
MSQDEAYQKYLKDASEAYEALCRRCGACCGVFEKDPCVKLVKEEDGRYSCFDYANRFGLQKTVNGNTFNCVTLCRIIPGSWPGSWQCGYKKQLKIKN